MSFCNKCGAQLPEGVKFCVSCGQPVEQPTQSQSANRPISQPSQQSGYPQPMQGGYQQPQQQSGYPQPMQGGYQQPQQQSGYPQPMQGGYQQPQHPGYQQPMQGVYQQSQQQGYQQPMQGGYQQPQQLGYQQPMQGGYQQPQQLGYQQPMQGGYQQPLQPGCQQPIQGGYQQQQYDYQNTMNQDCLPQVPQGYQQEITNTKVVRYIGPAYSEGTPTITIKWDGTAGSIDGMQNALNKKVAKSTKWGKKGASMQLIVNGQPVTEVGALNYYEPFSVEVPIFGSTIEITLTTGAWLCKDSVFSLVLDGNQSYVLEVIEPSILANSKIFGFNLYDVNGNYIQSYGIASKGKQWLSLIVPFVGFYFAVGSQEARESVAIKRIFLITAICSVILWGFLIFRLIVG